MPRPKLIGRQAIQSGVDSGSAHKQLVPQHGDEPSRRARQGVGTRFCEIQATPRCPGPWERLYGAQRWDNPDAKDWRLPEC